MGRGPRFWNRGFDIYLAENSRWDFTCGFCITHVHSQTLPGKCALKYMYNSRAKSQHEDFCIEKQLLEDSDAVIDWDVTVSAWHGRGFFTTSWLRRVERPEGARAWLLELFNAWLRMIPMAAKSKLQGNSLNANGIGNHATASTLACTSKKLLAGLQAHQWPWAKALRLFETVWFQPRKSLSLHSCWGDLMETLRDATPEVADYLRMVTKTSRSTSCSFLLYIM